MSIQGPFNVFSSIQNAAQNPNTPFNQLRAGLQNPNTPFQQMISGLQNWNTPFQQMIGAPIRNMAMHFGWNPFAGSGVQNPVATSQNVQPPMPTPVQPPLDLTQKPVGWAKQQMPRPDMSAVLAAKPTRDNRGGALANFDQQLENARRLILKHRSRQASMLR